VSGINQVRSFKIGAQKYRAFRLSEIVDLFPHPASARGAYRERHDT
jgi:hypothetical protein